MKLDDILTEEREADEPTIEEINKLIGTDWRKVVWACRDYLSEHKSTEKIIDTGEYGHKKAASVVTDGDLKRLAKEIVETYALGYLFEGVCLFVYYHKYGKVFKLAPDKEPEYDLHFKKEKYVQCKWKSGVSGIISMGKGEKNYTKLGKDNFDLILGCNGSIKIYRHKRGNLGMTVLVNSKLAYGERSHIKIEELEKVCNSEEIKLNNCVNDFITSLVTVSKEAGDIARGKSSLFKRRRSDIHIPGGGSIRDVIKNNEGTEAANLLRWAFNKHLKEGKVILLNINSPAVELLDLWGKGKLWEGGFMTSNQTKILKELK